MDKTLSQEIQEADRIEIPTFFGEPLLRGAFAEISLETIDLDKPEQFYTHPNGELWIGDSIAWLRSLESESVDLIFADPPYNIKKAEWDSFESRMVFAMDKTGFACPETNRNALCLWLFRNYSRYKITGDAVFRGVSMVDLAL